MAILFQAFDRRGKAVHPGEEAARWKQLSSKVMSDESSDEESSTMTVHKPVWRSKSKLSKYNRTLLKM